MKVTEEEERKVFTNFLSPRKVGKKKRMVYIVKNTKRIGQCSLGEGYGREVYIDLMIQNTSTGKGTGDDKERDADRQTDRQTETETGR